MNRHPVISAVDAPARLRGASRTVVAYTGTDAGKQTMGLVTP
ncbi:hypothetical protein [Streptomyces spinoverrucosus]|nr:hypothetical protein [Streptomyces spinoverrucosus]